MSCYQYHLTVFNFLSSESDKKNQAMLIKIDYFQESLSIEKFVTSISINKEMVHFRQRNWIVCFL